MGNSNTKQSENTVKNVAIAGAAVTALSVVGYLLFKNFKKSPTAPAVQESTSTTAPASTPAKPTLVRVDSELEMSSPVAPGAANPFEGVAPTSDWKTFTIKEAGFSVKYPEEFTPKKIANNLIEFGDRSSGLVAVAIERELTIEECRQLIQFSGGQQHAVKIMKEKKRKVNQGRHSGYEFEYQGNNLKYYSLFIPGVYGRSFMIQYELKKNNKFEIVKQILDSLSLEEPVYQGKIFVKVAAANLEIQLPQPYYRLREVNTYEDDSLLIDAFDSRFKNVTSGFRLFKRKEKTLEALVSHRRAELEEFSPEELQISLLPDAKFYKYERSIKQDRCTEIEALFVHQDVGYVAKIYSLTDIFDKFKKDGLTSLASIKPLKTETAKTVIVYENAKSGISMEVPASTLIREHPLSEDIVAEMTHEQFENAAENEEDFTTLIQAKKYANFTSDLKSFREMWLAENEMTSKNIRDKLGLDFLKVEKEGIVSQNGKDVFQVHLTTFHPITVEPQFAVISFWIKGTMLYQVQTTVSANSREQREPEMLAMHKTIHIK